MTLNPTQIVPLPDPDAQGRWLANCRRSDLDEEGALAAIAAGGGEIVHPMTPDAIFAGDDPADPAITGFLRFPDEAAGRAALGLATD